MKCSAVLAKLVAVLVLTSPHLACSDLQGEEPEPSSDAPQVSRQVQNLAAFARVYGYVRFFHPSDEASEIDWDRFAILGSERVLDADSPEELMTVLEELFGPLAPTARVFLEGDGPVGAPVREPGDTAGMKILAWQHLGFGQGGSGGPYRSIRINRENRMVSTGGGVLSQWVDAVGLRGQELRLRASVRAEVAGTGSQGALWLRVDREGGGRGFLDAMADRPITAGEWQTYEIVGDVAEDAARVVFGAIFRGEGRMWIDDVQLQRKDEGGTWVSVEVQNAGFEAGDPGMDVPGWSTTGQGTVFEVGEENTQDGRQALVISRAAEVFDGRLFEAVPSVGEAIEETLPGGVRIRIPLTLPSEPSSNEGPGPSEALGELQSELAAIDLNSLSADRVGVRLGGVVIAWNVFQHFYPYFPEVGVDWDAQLSETLERALADTDGRSFFRTLKRMVASLRDGHGRVIHPSYQPTAGLPLLFDWIEDRVVITASLDDRLQPGDILVSLDGVDAAEALSLLEELASGSPQWVRVRALRELGLGEEGSRAELRVRRGQEEWEIEIERGPIQALSEPRPQSIDELEEGILYVNLDQASAEEIRSRIDELASARGVVFDLRGYPNGNHQVIGHLLQVPDTSDSWMRVQQVIYPDQDRVAGYELYGWAVQPLDPHITGTAVFLTDGRAISYAESFMSFIEHYDLAEIVGQPTAGANGNVNPFTLPGGFRITWTGMKVVKHDGSQHHLIGVQPTVPMVRTIEGVREGRDELLERALEIIRGREMGTP
jgi:C-terminal processing protease CtpA/Prc